MIHWYSAETKNTSIIAYGDINHKRTFKVTYDRGIYLGYVLKKGKYEYAGQGQTLAVAQEFCRISLLY